MPGCVAWLDTEKWTDTSRNFEFMSPAAKSTHSGRPWEIPEIWVRFMLALIGLALAFTAALFSTVSRDSGNVWATVALAATALLLATLVGLST